MWPRLVIAGAWGWTALVHTRWRPVNRWCMVLHFEIELLDEMWGHFYIEAKFSSGITPQFHKEKLLRELGASDLVDKLLAKANKSWVVMSVPEIPKDLVAFLAEEGKDYCVTHGIVMVARDCCHRVEHAPFTLLPSPFPKRLFTQAKEVQKDFNLLVHKVSQDHEFLKEALQRWDAFRKKLNRSFKPLEPPTPLLKKSI